MKLKMLFNNCFLITSVIIFTSALLWLAGCSKVNNDKTPVNQTQQQAGKKDTSELSIVRDKNVNIDSIDSNKDGYLYQCEMDYDVISDKPGTCPKCGMELKKVTVAEAKQNFNSYNENNQ
jgi:hypothetical protein